MATLGATSNTTTFPTGSGTLEVKEIDGAPDVSNVTIIRVTNGTLTDDGGGQVTLSIGGGSNHDLLDGTVNQDTVAQTVSRGSLIYGNATPKWDELVIGAASTLLKSDGTDASWGTVNLLSAFHGDTLAGTVVRGDVIIGNSTPKWSRLGIGGASTLFKSDGTDPSWGTVNLLSAFHADTLAASPTRGDLIVANSTPAWSRKAVGTVNSVLVSDGTDPSWDVSPRVDTIYYEGRIIPTNIAAQADDYNPVDSGTSQSFHDVMQISMAATGAQTITGFDVGTTGEPKILTNRGTSTITLAHASGSSSANNQIWCPNATNYSLKQKSSVYMYYSQPDNKWVLVATEAGSAGSNALLDGSVHSDTVAQTVSRGSLVYGNSTPAWDELTIGAANTVLTSNGTDVSWAAPAATSQVLVATINLNTSDILAASTEKTVVSNPGSGKIVQPLFMWSIGSKTTGTTSAQPTFFFSWAGDGTNRWGSLAQAWTTAAGNISIAFVRQVATSGALSNGTDPSNAALVTRATADVTTANGFDGSIKIYVAYVIVTK